MTDGGEGRPPEGASRPPGPRLPRTRRELRAREAARDAVPTPPPIDAVVEGMPEPETPSAPMPFETASLAPVAPDAEDAPAFAAPAVTRSGAAAVEEAPEPAGMPDSAGVPDAAPVGAAGAAVLAPAEPAPASTDAATDPAPPVRPRRRRSVAAALAGPEAAADPTVVPAPTPAATATPAATPTAPADPDPAATPDVPMASDLPTAADISTQPLEAHELPTQAIAAADLPQPTEDVDPRPPAEQTGAPASEALAAPTGPSALDNLFGEHNFQHYEEGPTPAERPFSRRPRPPAVASVVGPTAAAAPRPPITRTQRNLLAVLGGLLAVIALVSLYLLGTRLTAILVASPVPTVTSASPTPTVAAPVPTGPVAVGVHDWSELRGGECLSPYAGPWAESYTVVDCAGPHPAQLVARGTFDAATPAPAAPATPAAGAGASAAPTAPASTYPGVDALTSQLSLLCSAPTVIDLPAAAAYTDIVLSWSYPVTAAQWDAGERSYFCFVSRSSGQPLTGSISVAK